MAQETRTASAELGTSSLFQIGVLTLTGDVDNLKAKRAAEDTARNTVGVWRVRNHLRVRPTYQFTDVAIAKDVRNKLTIGVD